MPDAPIQKWFALSDANYLVIPRSVLQSMPAEWQERFLAAIEEMDAALGHHGGGRQYDVKLRGADGRFVADPLADYERGRRRLESRRPEE